VFDCAIIWRMAATFAAACSGGMSFSWIALGFLKLALQRKDKREVVAHARVGARVLVGLPQRLSASGRLRDSA
jgi:hypothetical protein